MQKTDEVPHQYYFISKSCFLNAEAPFIMQYLKHNLRNATKAAGRPKLSHQVVFCLSASPSSSLFSFIFISIFPLTSSFVKIYLSLPIPQLKVKDSWLQSFLLTRFDYECKTLFLQIFTFCVYLHEHIQTTQKCS